MRELVRFVILGGHPLFSLGLRHTLTSQPHWQLVGEGTTQLELPTLLTVHRPDVALLDGRLPLGGDQCQRRPENLYHLFVHLPQWRRHYPTTHFVLLLENSPRAFLPLALQAGVSGCLDLADATPAGLLSAMTHITAGRRFFSPRLHALLRSALPPLLPPLSPRQLVVLATVVYHPDYTCVELAQALHLAIGGLRKHLHNIYHCLGVNSLTAAVLLSLQRGWFALENEAVPGNSTKV